MKSKEKMHRMIKAETHDATNRCDTSPRQVAATNRLVWHEKIIVAATEFRRCDLSHKFKLVWIRATYRSDKLSASDLSQQQYRRGDLSPRFVASCVSALIFISEHTFSLQPYNLSSHPWHRVSHGHQVRWNWRVGVYVAEIPS